MNIVDFGSMKKYPKKNCPRNILYWVELILQYPIHRFQEPRIKNRELKNIQEMETKNSKFPIIKLR